MKSQGKAIRVLLVDDHPVVREGLAKMLAGVPDIEVIGDSGDAESALQSAQALRPDVVLMDFRLPGEDGLVATRRICEALPQTRVLILTAYDERDLLVKAAQAGAAGLVLKDAPASQIVEAIHTICAGETYLPPKLVGGLFKQLRGGDYAAGSRLSEREQEILRLVAEGLSRPAIAARLFVSGATLRRDLHKAIKLLGASGCAEAVAKAVRKGLL